MIYHVSFRSKSNPTETFTLAQVDDAPRKAVRNARRRLAKDGIKGLTCTDCWRYRQNGYTDTGLVRMAIHRFALPWKW